MMIDIQSQPDLRKVAIDQVGVSELRYPIVILDRRNEKQHTVARLSMSVGLPHDLKGTHMSRFLEILHAKRGELTVRTLPAILRDVKEKLYAESARMDVQFPYFI